MPPDTSPQTAPVPRPRAGAGAVPHDQPDWHGLWVEALDELELEVDRAEALLRADHLPGSALPGTGAWRPPSLPPIPPDLVDRARGIHARQLDIASGMTRRLGDLAKQATLTGKLETGRERPRPLLVDRAC
ncbi:hypothetical protein EV189_0652 [Motilibacter rhizosphaerae]|uniref:Uncharacterized protein n=1 Tax=Motilibacter rhizosphaerae TaxID=598652 RepID=A0A4Q7NVX2_9ACTN|nr:hypothetical protein [Motilibacter rhizosphaerae]RZS91411.1 hypothetical protein EV189_0652 [Motilibacter rhizosphaerae]